MGLYLDFAQNESYPSYFYILFLITSISEDHAMFFQVLQWHVQWQSSSGGGQLGHGPDAEEVLEDQAGSDQGHREERRWVCGGIWRRSWCQIRGMSTLLNVVKWPLWIGCRWKCNVTGPGFSFSDYTTHSVFLIFESKSVTTTEKWLNEMEGG